MEPVTFGSGGWGRYGTNGGGRIKILVAGTLTNNGSISAEGDNGAWRDGAGAGGSIWIDVGLAKLGGLGILTGSGSISAKGGKGSYSSSSYGGGGGGGRLALHTVSYNFSGTIDVHGGNPAGGNSEAGGPGSFYTQITDQNSLCDLGTISGNDCLLTSNRSLGDGFVLSVVDYTIDSGGSLTGNIFLDVSGNLTLNAGGLITADGLGEAANSGPGASGPGGGGNCGAGHGGTGGRAGGAICGGPVYGDAINPITTGSGGAGGAGGYGGGVLKIFVQGTLTNNGLISANGANGSGVSSGGSGGSIWLDVGVDNTSGTGILRGSGDFTAFGGNGTGTFPAYDGGGGGGRVALHSANYEFTGTVEVKGGIGSGRGALGGNKGSYYLSVTSMDSLCDQGTMAGSDCLLTSHRDLGDGFTLLGTTYIVDNTGSLKGNFIMDLAGDLTINAGGIIEANGLGGYAVTGGSAGAGDGYGGAGGGHGGKGGRSRGGAAGGSTYGSENQPTTVGSGGGAGNAGRGGGALKILVQGTLTNNGIVSADGAPGLAAGGGGAGGSVWVDVGITNTGGLGVLTGTGLFSASGGNGSSSSSLYGGGAGGGRLALYSVDYLYRGSFDLSGGTYSGHNSVKGLTGSFYQQITNPDSLCDIGSFAGTCQINSAIVVGNGLNISGGGINNLTIDNGGSLTTIAANSDVEIILLGDLLINATGTLDVNLQRLEANNMDVYGNFNGNIFRSQLTNLNVHTGGILSATGTGRLGNGSFSTGNGSGGGTYNNYIGSGGGYGGIGGDGSNVVTAGSATYGTNSLPLHLGSGGGAGASTSQGGQGGGILYLNVSGTLTVDGTLAANGADGTLAAGGGSGGSLWLNATTLAGIAGGNILANGGVGGINGGSYGGGGGGGQIAIFAPTNTFGATPAANGGLKGGGTATDGAVGTVTTVTTLPDHIILLTSTLFDGNLGGIAGADSSCNTLIKNNSMAGQWRALLSATGVDASSRLNITKAVSNLRWDKDGGPQEVAANAGAFWGGTLAIGVLFDEQGVSTVDQVWTGTKGSATVGTDSTINCTDWTSNSATSGTYGASDATDSTWIEDSFSSCSNTRRLYCVSE